jgi:hypothetical protein
MEEFRYEPLTPGCCKTVTLANRWDEPSDQGARVVLRVGAEPTSRVQGPQGLVTGITRPILVAGEEFARGERALGRAR